MLEVRVARGRPGRPDPTRASTHSSRRLLRLLPLLALLCGALSAPALAAGGGGVPLHTTVRHASAAGHRNPLGGRAMWIWELPQSDGGSLSAISAAAHRFGLSTLIIKSSDGTNQWSQFNGSLVSALHAHGIRVCAWQYVYGSHPVTEAYKGAAAVHDGADCLVIDAESEYEGKYVSAQVYLQRLRKLVGYGYPLALAGFPYIDFHPAFPYSVFLGPGGAQYNAPQMYWRDIGTTTDAVFGHTYAYNLIYQRPIFPLGQIYGRPPAHQVVRFRQLARVYGASGLSWWDWQEAGPSNWIALSRPVGALHGYAPYKQMADIGQGLWSDLVVWAQEHLVSAGYPLQVSGDFGYHTRLDVQAFQAAHGLTADGIIGPATWSALLRYRIARVRWSVSQPHDTATV
ncbi:MAG TPA: peptidoglycan-binding domain-containing protein, partial [Solirubrobacteraceae bacterium]|nr:peptidoglycan-binding domain-containing protein [Solirubrobacteraceae bacterium]